MKFVDVKKMLGNKNSVEEIKKAIAKIKPVDIKRRLRGKKNGNLILKILKGNLSSNPGSD